jgi:succinyl-diaminopimelate desuccinylase
LDTVPIGKSWTINPFAAKILNNRIYGLGATDCKVNIACALEAINSIVEEKIKLNYSLIFAATCDEECGSYLGLIPLLERNILRPTAAVVLDSDDFEIVVTQKGLVHLRVEIQGKRAHGAYPWRGINAIDIAIDIIKEIKEQKFSCAKNKHLRPPTINIGTMKGGDKVNIVADWCEFELDFRFLPGMSANTWLRRVKGIIKKHTHKFRVEIDSIQDPYCISETHSLVSYLKKAMRRMDLRPKIKGSEGATVITFFQQKNIPAVSTGFGCGGCGHIANEYVKIDNLYKGAQALEEFLKIYHFNNK